MGETAEDQRLDGADDGARATSASRPALALDRPPITAPPLQRRRRRVLVDLAALTGFVGRRRSFWGGAGGLVTSIVIGSLVVFLLFGWVRLWLAQKDGPSVPLLILGCMGFTIILAFIATLQNRLQTHWRLRAAEAAFLAGFSHSFRTPISAIRAAAQALQSKSLSEAQRSQLLGAIVHETRRLGLRVDNVLETTRQELERSAFSREGVPLDELLQVLIGELEPNVASRRGQVTARIAPEIEVQGDARALRLLFENLLDNALRFGGEAPQIRVFADSIDDLVFVRIEDFGQGFLTAERPDRLRRFRAGDGGRGGLGIGLAIARSVARGHGGELHLQSKGPGAGAVVEVWLPRAGALN